MLTKTSVELALDRGTLELRSGHAQLGGVDLQKVQATIRNLETEPLLTLDAAGRGPLAEMLRIVNTTPVGGWIDKALEASTATGAADLKLNLAIPVMKVEAASA